MSYIDLNGVVGRTFKVVARYICVFNRITELQDDTFAR